MQNPVRAEASLFYSRVEPRLLVQIAPLFVAAFRASGIAVTTRHGSSSALALDIGGLTLSLSHSGGPIDLGPYMMARTPQTEFGLPHATQRVLAAHHDALVISVHGPAACASQAAALAVCCVAVLEMLERAEPALIHWQKSQIFYNLDEFRAATTPRAPHPVPPARRPNATPVEAAPQDVQAARQTLETWQLAQAADASKSHEEQSKDRAKSGPFAALLTSHHLVGPGAVTGLGLIALQIKTLFS